MKAVVIEPHRAHVIAADGNIVSTPSRAYAMTIPQLAAHAITRATGPDVTLAIVTHPLPNADVPHIVSTIRAAGWEVTDTDAEAAASSGWLTLRRKATPTIHVHVTGWRKDADQLGALWEPTDDAATIADRLARWYALTGGRTWHTHPANVAAGWLRAVVDEAAAATNRRHGVVWRYEPRFVPPSLGFGEWVEPGLQRPITRVPGINLNAYDGNGEWLAALSAVELPYGTLEQVGGPVPFDRLTAGWWLVDTRDANGDPELWWTWATRSDQHPPLIRQAPNAEGRVWLSTVVMRYLAEAASGGWELTPLDAILPAPDSKVRRRSGRILRPWAEEVSQARTTAILAEDTVMVEALKAVYAVAVTVVLVGARINRRDWRAMTNDTIMVSRHRRYAAGTAAGGQMLATQADASWWLVSPSNSAALDKAMGLRDRHLLGGTKRHDKPIPTK